MNHRAMLHALTLLAAGAILTGCNFPLLRPPPSTSTVQSSDKSADTQTECASLSDEIKTNENEVRQAPSTSTNEDIVAAAQGKADKQLDDLRTQYDALGCPAAQLPPTQGRFAPVPAAPGGRQP